jgi:hypothetical protein
MFDDNLWSSIASGRPNDKRATAQAPNKKLKNSGNVLDLSPKVGQAIGKINNEEVEGEYYHR